MERDNSQRLLQEVRQQNDEIKALCSIVLQDMSMERDNSQRLLQEVRQQMNGIKALCSICCITGHVHGER